MEVLRKLTLLSLLSACASPAAKLAPPAALDLPPAWLACGAYDFEQLALAIESVTWSPFALNELRTVLAQEGLASVRAAVLLARGDESALEVLLARLEERQVEASREGDAAEVVAAAALATSTRPGCANQLAQLAAGAHPHPDLEVRVECAASALDLGEASVIPFMLRVLHAGTPTQLTDPIDWEETDTLAWAKSRAAEALSRRAGVPCNFRPDGSFAHQNAEADHLQNLLLKRP